ncbi:hypothetical protein PPL_05705 [Heterostelium album PN500]|uniref:WAP domain-containing protein n=1 Tax=Heterostelium pallidum (strain ATCC 26659 / Pp 5 / PN500) TaxID=670386 RepID=D3BAX4_HETP5|nr:hypothetical protein PPL_05705 [Heterostelium album PN500]EFA81711.1 hypothetical protein PPL_05705 [Heterostelium album PN500]|eukprot:XP_020433828.1 hypothetical protein PPL_05705 [Heterostelium album PN500]
MRNLIVILVIFSLLSALVLCEVNQVQLKCPPHKPGTFGACIEACGEGCAKGYLCCYNGCGHVCMKGVY